MKFPENSGVMGLALSGGILVALMMLWGCESKSPEGPDELTVPHEGRWGIYALEITSEQVSLLYSSDREIFTSALRLNGVGDRLLFAQAMDGDSTYHFEICSIGVDGSDLIRHTDNLYWDLYPAWSPDDARIVFLTLRQTDLDIYIMNADGSDQHELYDSGSHDADVDWEGNSIVFTANSCIWKINSLGTDPVQLTNPPRAGEWGNANLPFGDYDPRLNSDGSIVVLGRLEDDLSPNGNYNLFIINADGSGETRLTDNGYAQGLAAWSHSSDKIAYVVAAIGDQGLYDLYMMNSDGTNNQNITPDYFPLTFLCYAPAFSLDDAMIYFVGVWY